jgi:hypothetical protein
MREKGWQGRINSLQPQYPGTFTVCGWSIYKYNAGMPSHPPFVAFLSIV